MARVIGIGKKYGDKTVFSDFTAEFPDGKVTAVMGASGAGKTTLLNIIAGLTPFSGRLEGFGDDVSYVFQSPRLIPEISVVKNIEFVLKTKYPTKAERRARATRYLAECEIESLADKFPTEISGGEGQRVQLARAFAYPSETMLLDEPFSSLDVALKSRLMRLCADLLQKMPRTAVFVTHDVDEALTLADNVLILSGGGAKIIEVAENRFERRLSGEKVNAAREKIYSELLGK